MSKDDSSAHVRPHAGNVAIVTGTAERLGIVPPEIHQRIPYRTINPETGFLESNAIPDTFDSTRKLAFLQSLRSNDFKFEITCKEFGVSPHTVYKHRRIDPEFNKAVLAAIEDYADNLEWFSRSQAMQPRATLERIFQLRALKPQVYARENMRDAGTTVTLNITGFSTEKLKARQQVIDAETLKPLPEPDDGLHITMHNSISPSGNNSSSEPHAVSPDGNTAP